jgi:hypothetical protein
VHLAAFLVRNEEKCERVKLSLSLINKHYVVGIGGVEVLLHAHHFILMKNSSQYPFDTRLDRPYDNLERYGEEKVNQ